MHKSIALFLGIAELRHISDETKNYIDFDIPSKSEIPLLSFKFDLSRSIKEIKLYSKNLFNYPTEMCFKVFTKKELNFLKDPTSNNSFITEFQTSNLNSKLYKVDRYNVLDTKFYFLDIFDSLVHFNYCQIILFVSNKA